MSNLLYQQQLQTTAGKLISPSVESKPLAGTEDILTLKEGTYHSLTGNSCANKPYADLDLFGVTVEAIGGNKKKITITSGGDYSSISTGESIVIVTDSMGIGEAKDAKKYNDLGSNTFGHIADLSLNFNVPTLEWLGIGNICKNTKIPPKKAPNGVVARMHELSVGKDTLTGHYELMGLRVDVPFKTL
jgi:hypothetical protein